MTHWQKRVLTQVYVAVGGILEKDGKFLLVREAYGTAQGKWNVPAGWIDPGEDPVIAAKREVEEETGFDFTPTDFVGLFSIARTFPNNDIHHGIRFMVTGTFDDSNPKPLADDITETKWFTLDEVKAMVGTTLRRSDIPDMFAAYLAGQRFPLSLITHTTTKETRP